jgi:hypothetical protein
MAVIQLGNLVTAVKGSVGGTCFKTQRGSQVMYRKSNGYSKNKLYLNSALGYARYIFAQWSLLTAEQQGSWNTEAAILLFPDKFGNQVHITGRQLYTKCNLNLRGLDYIPEPIGDFTSGVSVFLASGALVDIGDQSASVGLTIDAESPQYLFVSAEVSVNNLPAPVFSRRKILKTISITTDDTLSFGTEFFQQFPYVNENYKVRFYVDIMNGYGFKGLPQAIDAAVSL